MTPETVQTLFSQHWKPGWGSVSVDEIMWIQYLISKYRPKRFLEIGMASGMSAGFIANFLEENGGKSLTSIDHDDTFFGDKSKPNGFLVSELYYGEEVTIRLEKFKISLDLPSLNERYDMVFIDANHQHPWPLIDTLAVWPHLDGSKIMIHHDLQLFMKQDKAIGIGPKYLYDQFPNSHRTVSQANNGNIFMLRADLDKEQLIEIAFDGFKLPWSLLQPMSAKHVERIEEMLMVNYGTQLQNHFRNCAKIFNQGE